MFRTPRVLLPLLLVASLTQVAGPASAACPDSILYVSDFDSLSVGSLPTSPGTPQGGWYAVLRTGGAIESIQNTVANSGQSIFLDAPIANPTGLQTIARHGLTHADLVSCPIVDLAFDFYCTTSDVSASNIYDVMISVDGGPFPGYSIIQVRLTSGNGTPKSQGVRVSTDAFDPASQNNFPVPITVGQNLSWGAWHRAELILDHAADRLLLLMVDGQAQDLSAYQPGRSCSSGTCSRGQLTEQLNVQISPNDSPQETYDQVYFDNIRVRTLPPLQSSGCAVSSLIAITGNQSVSLSWRPAAPAGFANYAVYRSTAPFFNVSDLTPISIKASRTDTTYVDSGLVNGTSYFYAVLASISGGPTCEVITAVPRRPRSETDLQVITISRQPRYPRYDPLYSTVTITEPSGFGPYNVLRSTGLGSGQTPSTQRWPRIGDPVSYVATVRNRGTNTWSGAIHGQWSVDGGVVMSPTISGPLSPDARTTSTYVRTWDGGSHAVEFRLLDSDARPSNNLLSINTKSVAFLTYIDRSFIEDFRDAWSPSYPFATTDDIFDWINSHMARFNQLFAQAGTSKRVHYDTMGEVRDGDPDPVVTTINYAIFPFRFHVGQDNYRAGSAYYSNAEDIDYGYLHEMGHQLGLIDIYRMSVGASVNQVSGTGYAPASDLMFNVAHVVGPSDATAMTHWLDTAHGYFGQYLYGLPKRVLVRFVGSDGGPLANTPVNVYQYCDRPVLGEILTNQVKASGVTNSKGFWQIPNVAIDTTVVPPTFVGDTLRANPWGYVNMLGNNGTLLLEVTVGGVHDYAWLDITEANVAYYSGLRDSFITEKAFTTVHGPITGVSGEPSPAPRFYLAQNQPNPFNPDTRIWFGLSGAAHVRLVIYDVTGRLVRVLVDGTLPSGLHEARWDGLNDRENPVASGCYFYQLTTGSLVERRRMVLLR